MSLPGGVEARVVDSGNEISMSVEETNRVRAALGLKPLQASKPEGQRRPPPPEKPREASKNSADELAERIQRRRDKRKAEERKKVKTLGEADAAEDDDMAAWVEKNRRIVEERAAKEEEEEEDDPRKPPRSRGGDDDDDEDAEGKYSARHLAGVKVKHDYKDLGEGETMILTLADRGILNEKGDMDDDETVELENVLKAEHKKRQKAWEAAGKKAKPLFEEDGKKRGLLDKYDEEEEQMMQLDDSGTVGVSAAVAANRQEEIKRKLAEGLAGLEEPGVKLPSAAADYFTAEEMASFSKPRKTKKKKLRQKAAAEEEDTANLIAALEAQAEVAGVSNLGTRADRLAARDKQAQQAAEKLVEKSARFTAALDKANWASLALRPQQQASTSAPEVMEDADDELYLSLQRARRVALQQQEKHGAPVKNLQEVATHIIKKREEEEAGKTGPAGGLEFNEASEFIRSIAVGGTNTAKPATEESSYMDVDDGEAAGARSEAAPRAAAAKEAAAKPKGGWRHAEEDEDMEDAPSVRPSGPERGGAAPEAEGAAAIAGERAVGRGLFGALGILKEKGMLREKVEWAGRINDRKQTTMQQLADVYTGGSSEDKIARSVEAALTQRDEYGRILTPRERFRLQCYRFHGKGPSKNKIEKKTKKTLEEIASRKAATSDNHAAEANEALTKQLGVPHVVLTGKNAMQAPGKSGSKRKEPPPSKVASLTPMLGGGMTPLTDPTRKVEMMMGIRKPSSNDMPPPGGFKKPKSS